MKTTLALLALFVPLAVHAQGTPVQAHIILASVTHRSALVALTDKTSIAFGHCELPLNYVPTLQNTVPVYTMLRCNPIGEALPNTAQNQLVLEKYFKIFLTDRIKRATGGEAMLPILRRSLIGGGVTGLLFGGATLLVAPKMAWSGRLTGMTLVGAGASAVGAWLGLRNVYSAEGSSTIVAQVRASNLITAPGRPIVLEDLNYAGVLPQNGFNIARKSLADAVDRMREDLAPPKPGGGSAGGAGASSSF